MLAKRIVLGCVETVPAEWGWLVGNQKDCSEKRVAPTKRIEPRKVLKQLGVVATKRVVLGKGSSDECNFTHSLFFEKR